MAISRRDMFGYAGSSHQSQEGAYGALMSPSLYAEEEYGDDLDDDEFGLDDDDDDYGFDDDDDYGFDDEFGDDEDDEFGDDEDDDEFGALDSESLFAEEAYGDDLEAELDALDAELDQEIYGAWYGVAGGTLAAPPGAGQTVDALAQAVDVGAFLPSFAQSAGAEPGWIEWGVEKMRSFLEPGDADEIATYLMNQPGFANWHSLNEAQQAQLVKQAVTAAAIPGLEANWDEPFRQAFSQNPGVLGSAWAALSSTPSAIWGLITSDYPNAMFAVLQEIPGVGAALKSLMKAAKVRRPDQILNGLAIRYYILGLVYPTIYTWIAQSVTRQGQAAIAAVASTRLAVQDAGPIPPSQTVVLDSPPQAVVQPSTGLPSPPAILAVGFGLSAAGAVLGIFK